MELGEKIRVVAGDLMMQNNNHTSNKLWFGKNLGRNKVNPRNSVHYSI